MLSEVLECFCASSGSSEMSAKARFLRPLLWDVKIESRLFLTWGPFEGRALEEAAVVARREERDVAKARFEVLVLEEVDLLRGVDFEGYRDDLDDIALVEAFVRYF